MNGYWKGALFAALSIVVLGHTGAAIARDDTGLVTVIKGEANKRAEAGHWKGLKEQERVSSGEQIRTLKKSLAEIVLHKTQKIRLGPETTVDFQDVFEKGEKKVSSLDLRQGDVWAEVAKLNKDSSFKINNRLAHATVRGTIFSLHADKKKAVLNVYRGAVEVSGKQKKKAATEQPSNGSSSSSESHAFREPHEIAGPTEAAGPHEVAGPKEVTMKQWIQIVHTMQQIVVSSDGSWQVHDIDRHESQNAQWRQWGKEIAQ